MDHMSYIFGSFSRRRQTQDAVASKRRSVQHPGHVQPVKHAGSAVLRENGVEEQGQFTCPECRRRFVEPRVLPCLHTFCTSCLHQLEGASAAWAPDSQSETDISHVGVAVSMNGTQSCSSTGSGGSGSSESTWVRHRLLLCPTCGSENLLPAGGVAALPPNYVLQHRMVVCSLGKDPARLLCDLCSSSSPATSRCTDCLTSLCSFCSEAHKRQRYTSSHTVLGLQEACQLGVAEVRRQALCPVHPDHDLQLFCVPCCQVVCRECCLLSHQGHSCETVSRAAHVYKSTIQEAVQRAKPMAEQAFDSVDKLKQLEHTIEARCTRVDAEIDQFIDDYISALEEHRLGLHLQVQHARSSKVQLLHSQQRELQRRAEDTKAALMFAEELLAEGSHTELLSFVAPILRRLQWCSDSKSQSAAGSLLEPRTSDCLQFLRHESAGLCKSYMLFGVVTTQTVSPQHCVLNVDDLQNCRQHRRTDVTLVTRDCDDQPLCHGGEKVTAELRYRDSSRRKIPVQVSDQRDGSYRISFAPDAAGNLSVFAYVNNKPIKGSPFQVCVRTLRPHPGTFHCCSFCSSHGSKEATCGCGGTMPGGYRGCGHGHAGHPGCRHWSCCGNVLENSECGQPKSSMYQFTL